MAEKRLGKHQRYLLEWLTHEYCNPEDCAFYARDRRILKSLLARGLVELDPGNAFEPARWYITDAGRDAREGQGE